jgi:hypothetical protein
MKREKSHKTQGQNLPESLLGKSKAVLTIHNQRKMAWPKYV